MGVWTGREESEIMRKWWKYLRWFIIINFVAEIVFGFYMEFFVVGGTRYPLWMQA